MSNVTVERADIRCPSCRELVWYFDGLTLTERADGTLRRDRIREAGDPSAVWACSRCGYEVPDWAGLRRRLATAAADVGHPLHAANRAGA